jgi:FKBP-type peptidyl-prolyl cis-trans isomerase
MKKLTSIIALSGLTFLMSCGDSRFPGFDKTDDGIYYKVHKEGSDKTELKEGDVLFISQIMHTEKDSMLFDSRTMDKSQGPYAVRIGKSAYPGDMFDALKMLHVGDSTTFCLLVSDMWTKGYKQPIPAFLDSNSYLKYSIKIDSFYTKEKVDNIEKEQMAKQEAIMKMYESVEDSLLNSYLTSNKINVKPTESGLYFIEKQKGSGPLVKAGDNVTVSYTGMFTNGDIFDSSKKHDEDLTFPAGAGQVIPAWDEAILKMCKGTKALLVCPSKIGYGKYGSQGVIPPFAPLVFEMEVTGINSAK